MKYFLEIITYEKRMEEIFAKTGTNMLAPYYSLSFTPCL
ncbi:MAG: hypothetical protein JETT_1403 [Candidatus Jettenia ecosi]|uniref:Uncharacterized protein n=1 Tax=Candidatus Jettenia ecosi TaxID=2494326 RepID=A0A533QC45_9BACT|nr:MAG: hypothetical protein JETT_1403 [Candidatus Jettenia ecosi]